MSDNSLIPLLRIHDTCQGLSDSDIEAVAALGEVIHAKTGEFIQLNGQRLEHLYLVIRGRLKMVVKSLTGQAQTIRYIAPGDQFGALILVSEDDCLKDFHG